MRASLDISRRDMNAFDSKLDLTISKVGRGSRKATVEACRVISEESLNQVPRDTGTLALSQYWEVTGHWKTGWTGTIGYGGNGNPINPKTGRHASSYATVVHEDLTVSHPNGKAKFLEDPLRAYASEHFPRTVLQYIEEAIAE